MKNWQGIYQSNPDDPLALRMSVRELIVAGKVEDAAALVRQGIARRAPGPDTALLEAELLFDVGEHQAADRLFRALLAESDADPKALQRYIPILRGLGRIGDADALLPAKIDTPPYNTAAFKGLRDAALLLSDRAPEALAAGVDARPALLQEAVRRFAGRKVTLTSGRVGPVAQVTVGLGTGGAERQFCHLLRGLQGKSAADDLAPGVTIEGPLHALSLNLSSAEKRDFFLPQFLEAGIAVADFEQLAQVPLSALEGVDPGLSTLLPLLPPRVQAGISRLVPWLRETGAEVICLWQDSAIFTGALAALIAGVPRIQLNLRGPSPRTRHAHMLAPFAGFYRALADTPGVEFLCNSPTIAEDYGDWLDLSPQCFTVLPNGSEPPNRAPDERDEALWHDFSKQTAGANRTIGVVCRFHPGKRIALWVDFAQTYLSRHPDARFILVGHGVQSEEIPRLARERGIDDRMLFVGTTRAVGYWLDRMDAFLLLSKSEGMPNVLVEAQMRGVPVVSTPAGAARICYAEGDTGATISDFDNPDLEEASDLLDHLIARRRADPDLSKRASARARKLFSVPSMVANYARAMTAPLQGK